MRLTALSPLAVVVLELLHEKPMHPYEIQRNVVERGLDEVIKFRPASMYSTVEKLAKSGLIERVETSRDGRRPERTVYEITEAGTDSLLDGLRGMLSEPTAEYPAFAAGLALLAVFRPEEAIHLLEWRIVRLEAAVAASEAMLSGVARSGLPRLFSLESEYALHLRRAELQVTRDMVEEMKSGQIVWPDTASATNDSDQRRENGG